MNRRNDSHDETNPAFGNRSERSKARADAIDQFLRAFAPCDSQDQLAEMMVTITRLAADGCNRGDVKLLNRALKELRYAFKVFAPFASVPKVSIFGSARTPVGHPQYQQAVKFSCMMREHGWMIITGAGDGIMRAGHDGATREASFGVSISLPFEQTTNDIIAGDAKLVNFKYFFTRKLLFVKEADAIILFPGGYGTQDEGFEALTLIQTGKSEPVPIVLCDEPGGTYWQHWRTWVKAELLANGMISPQDMGLFFLTDRVEDAVNEILRFYRRYHSSRYVQDQFVIRMKSRISDAALQAINDQFPDIVGEDRIRQIDHALPEEEGEYAELARLVFRFDRRSLGRLRFLINAINGAD
ncbi:MAG: LOG family protein [Phycisphaerales bacterium]|nr:LOG family protein [Phycisphaerales bacterium]